ncbi:MAG: ATP-binding protein [Cyanophyceae cyanobacterium]
MKLRTKILIGYGVALALVILVCGWGIVNLRRLGRASEAILRENYRSILAAENMIDAIERQDSANLLFLLENQQQGVEQFRENEILFLQWLARAKDNVTISGEDQLLATLEEEYKNYLDASYQLQQRNQNPINASTSQYYETVFPIFERVQAASVELRELNQETMVAASDQTQDISEQAIWSMVAAGGTAAGVGLVFSLLLSNRIVQPLKQMSRATSRIAEGDYDIAIPLKSKDELGRLAREITAMSQKLKAFHELNVGKVIAEKQRSEAIIQSISDGLIVVDADFKVMAINPAAAALTNLSSSLATRSHFLDVVNNQDLYQYIKTTAETGTPPQLPEEQKILALERGEKTQYYKFAITSVTSEAGAMLGVILLLQDVTKLKELDQLKSEFVATASHELRTPLTGMSMSLSLLLETAAEKLSEREQELLTSAEEDVERLRDLVNDLLDLSKIESGRIEMEFTSVEVDLLLEKAASMLQVQAQEKQIDLVKQALPDSPKVKADPNKIIWVLTNLIANAIRYTDSGKEIRLEAKHRGTWVQLSVVDEGAGIPYEYQERIFDKFVQVKTEKDVGGSGLGLAICQEIVKAHGGTIWVDSTPGEGSTFSFTVPATNYSMTTNKELANE